MALEIEFAGRRPVVDAGAFVAPTAALVGDVPVAAGTSVWYVARRLLHCRKVLG